MDHSDFEKQVADIYRLMGYEVATPAASAGPSFDLLVTQTLPGVGAVPYAVNCKHSRTTKVGAQPVESFLAARSGLELEWRVRAAA